MSQIIVEKPPYDWLKRASRLKVTVEKKHNFARNENQKIKSEIDRAILNRFDECLQSACD